MTLWKDSPSPKADASAMPQSNSVRLDDAPIAPMVSSSTPYRANSTPVKESLIAPELTIEGKIEGAGNIRMAGNFKGTVNVSGNLTIEPSAKVTGSVSAQTIIIAGELDGNIDSATHVELLETGVLNGDLRAGTFVVASGSRMRGQVTFGWEESTPNVRPVTSLPAAKREKEKQIEVLSSS